MLYNIFDSRHMSNLAANFQKEKQNVYRNSQVSKQRKQKNIKKRGCTTAFKILPNFHDGAFLREYND